MILLIIGGGLAGLAALPRGGGATAQETSSRQDVITSDSHFFGQSPPVYPSPEITGTGEWADSFTKAKLMVSQMTLEEKLKLTGGLPVDNGCSGNIAAIPRLGFPGMCLSDAGNGLRATDFVSSWPSGIHVGASWNKDLTRARAFWMGAEFRKKGVNVLLGPVVGPMGRTVRGGRNWEGMSVDPYLAGILVHETVVGTQQMGVITSTKHFIANEQETARMPSNNIQALSSNIDDKTMHEFYLWPFQDAVHAGSANIMCSYQRVNNSYGCANSKTLNGLLKTELGFQGFVVSDWSAQHAGVATALAGLDMTMPTGATHWGDNLATAVRNSSVPESRLTDMALRVIASWYRLGQDKDFPTPGIGMPANVAKAHQIIDGRNSSAKPALMEGAIEGHVLVKNANNALPLNKPRTISVFGYSAKLPDINGPTGPGVTAWTFGGISANSTEVVAGFSGGAPEQVSGIAANGTLFSGGGSGATSQSTLSAPFDALTQQAQSDDTEMYWDLKSGNPVVPSMSEACLVFGNAFASESYDRPALRDDFTDGLILNVANQCNNTIVVLHNAGIRVVDRFIEHPNVTALIFAHLPGQYSGRALVALLYGQANPSGKLPYTVARNESDYGTLHAPDIPDRSSTYRNFPQADFAEGVFVDYRYFDARNITPRFEFGFGLSYTTFTYANLRIDKPANSTGNRTAEYPIGPIQEGGQKDLWDVLVTVTANITNTGKLGGAEVAQLYLSLPGAGSGNGTAGGIPIRQLRGFEKPYINATQTANVKFPLTRRDLSVWDTVAQKWRLQPGTYTAYVGSSSRLLPLNGTFTLP